MSDRDIEWGIGFGGDDGEVRYYDHGLIVHHHGDDAGAHHASWRSDDDDLAILTGAEALRRILADAEIVHGGAGESRH